MTLEQFESWGTDPTLSQTSKYNFQSFLHVQGSSVSLDSTNLELRSAVVFTIEKHLSTSGPVQFKPVLFKGQLYIKSLEEKKKSGLKIL